MRILIVKTSSMGDVLHTLPALTDALNQRSDIEFDWVVEENFSEIPVWHYGVKNVIPVALRRWRKSWFSSQTRTERKAFISRLQSHQYDCVIDAQGLIKSAFLVTRLAKGKKHGLNWASAREPLASLCYDIKHDIPKKLHAVERTRMLFAKSLGYPVPTRQGDYAIATNFVSEMTDFPALPYLVFLHSTTRDEKHWTESGWRELIARVIGCGFLVHIPWGSEKEKARAERLAQGFSGAKVLPKLSLGQVAVELANARAVVSVDTGLSHLAAALDRPNVTLYGPTDPGLIGGYGKNQVVCKVSDNLNELEASVVFQKLQPFLA